MPIPQLSRKSRSAQGWRDTKSHSKKTLLRTNKSKPYLLKNKKGGFDIFSIIPKEVLIKYALIAFIGGSLFSIIFVAWVSRGLPDPNRLIERKVSQSTKIYDRTGETILYEIHGDEKRTLVDLKEIPDYLEQATIAIEDKDFYNHGGFSVWAIFRTAVTNVLFGKKAGGSTLTQQFVKNSVLTNEKTYTRKIKELILAYRLEKKFSKDEILQMYLNEIPYGSTAYGVEAASRRYFDKSVKDINLAEAAILAALPQAPSRYSPYGGSKDLLIARQHYILDLMVKQGHVTKEEAEVAKGVQLDFKEQSNNIVAPHFVMYVKELLGEKYGEKMIEQEGLKIYTTLDLYKQKIAEEVVVAKTEKYIETYDASNAALVSIDPKTGQILAMVGSRDYFNDEIDGQVNIATSLRQPGSSIKPLVYAAAFIKGFTPNTVLYDVVTNFSDNPDTPYEPHNYNDKELGPVTIRKALAGSLNIPAVKALYLAGVDSVLALTKELGYTSLKDKDRYGLSLVLGGGEVKLLEHTNAFSVFAREGEIHPTSAILKIEDSNGKVIEEFKETKGKKIIEAKIARMINGVLSDNEARAYAFGENNWLTLGDRPVAAKTGTTNDYRDAWTIGYTPSIVTGVWAGNNDNHAMKRGAGGSALAAPIWHDYMAKILGDTPIETFNPMEEIKTGKPVLDGEIGGGNKIKIDKISGLLATEYTPQDYIEEVVFNEDHCILYYIDKNDPLGDPTTNSRLDPQFNLWEERVLQWSEAQGFKNNAPPTEYDNVHKPENRPTFSILEPSVNQNITEPYLRASVSASAPRGVGMAQYFIDHNLIYQTTTYPFSLNKNIDFLNNGFHNLTIRVCDDIGNCSEQSLEFNLNIQNHKTGGDIDLSWSSPSSGLAINQIDFPLHLKFNLFNPLQVAKVIIYYKEKTNNNFKTLKTIAPIEINIINSVWDKIPPTGEYTLYGEAYGWNGQKKTSNQIILNINNEIE